MLTPSPGSEGVRRTPTGDGRAHQPGPHPMTVDLVDKYDVNVPRYTSYPTAPHFTPAVDADRYRRWLACLPADTELSLYFHIPFCDSMCWFCGCYTKIVHRYEPISEYLAVLLSEIGLVASLLPHRLTVRHLHWGGGSPTMLTGDDWSRMIGLLRQHFNVRADAEIAVELDPRETTPEYVAALGAAGVNRASIGVQDFHPDVQRAINRIQPFEVVERVVTWLREHGIEAVNLDLMYGLPHQTVERVVDMAERATSLEPARLALFGYAHVPWMKSHQRLIDEQALPNGRQRWQQCAAAGERLVAFGYRPIGLDHFARPHDTLAAAAASGRLRRNFQGYTTDDAPVLLGFGASAISSLPHGYVQNLSPLKDYARAIAEGHPPTARGIALTEGDRVRAAIIERLMCDLSVDVEAVCRRHDADAAEVEDAWPRLAPLTADGIARIEGSRIRVTDAGRPFVRLVAAAFDQYLQTGRARHSRAV